MSPSRLPENPTRGTGRESKIPTYTLWRSELLHVGEFIASPRHRFFHDSGPCKGCNVVFPRSLLRICWGTERRWRWSDPAVINFYNDGDVYQRRAESPEGDRSVWIELQPKLLEEFADRLTDGKHPRPDLLRRPFEEHQAPSDPRLLLSTLELADDLRTAPDTIEPLAVEERALAVIDGALSALGKPEHGAVLAGEHPAAARVDASREILASRLDQKITLAQVASAVGSSASHLARTFRAVMGITMGGYRLRLRLARACERLLVGDDNLTELALDLGFSSHSYFTAIFRRHLRATPSEVRRRRRPHRA